MCSGDTIRGDLPVGLLLSLLVHGTSQFCLHDAVVAKEITRGGLAEDSKWVGLNSHVGRLAVEYRASP